LKCYKTVELIINYGPYALEITYGLTKSKKQFQTLKASIDYEGILESINMLFGEVQNL